MQCLQPHPHVLTIGFSDGFIVILTGHSMSGAIALEAALDNPTRVIGVVGVDNFKNFGAIQMP